MYMQHGAMHFERVAVLRSIRDFQSISRIPLEPAVKNHCLTQKPRHEAARTVDARRTRRQTKSHALWAYTAVTAARRAWSGCTQQGVLPEASQQAQYIVDRRRRPPSISIAVTEQIPLAIGARTMQLAAQHRKDRYLRRSSIAEHFTA
jgi:hypothetical protein